ARSPASGGPRSPLAPMPQWSRHGNPAWSPHVLQRREFRLFRFAFRSFALAAVVLSAAVLAGAAQAREAVSAYAVQPLVSDSSATPAASTDPSLVNGWGLSAGPTTPWWASDNGTN